MALVSSLRPFALAALLACAPVPLAWAEAPTSAPGPASAVTVGEIHNAFRVSEHIYSGSQPEAEADYAALARLGIKTIISVDGSKPHVDLAKKHGLAYVHLPFGYDGISETRTLELATAAKRATGPIFVHCHHGKHRGPAAVAILCVTTQHWTPPQAQAWLKQAGVSPDYPGLYRSVESFKVPTETQIAQVGPLREIAETDLLVDSMVTIDSHFDRLKTAQKGGWKTAERAQATESATLLWEAYREMARTEDTRQRPADYRAKLSQAEEEIADLRTLLKGNSGDTALLDTVVQVATKSCTSCHKAFRN